MNIHKYLSRITLFSVFVFIGFYAGTVNIQHISAFGENEGIKTLRITKAIYSDNYQSTVRNTSFDVKAFNTHADITVHGFIDGLNQYQGVNILTFGQNDNPTTYQKQLADTLNGQIKTARNPGFTPQAQQYLSTKQSIEMRAVGSNNVDIKKTATLGTDNKFKYVQDSFDYGYGMHPFQNNYPNGTLVWAGYSYVNDTIVSKTNTSIAIYAWKSSNNNAPAATILVQGAPKKSAGYLSGETTFMPKDAIRDENGYPVYRIKLVAQDSDGTQTTIIKDIQLPNGGCGDDVIEEIFGEECDDGNTVNGDGCSDSCQAEICGDESVQSGETCDQGAQCDNGDTCYLNTKCVYEYGIYSCADGSSCIYDADCEHINDCADGSTCAAGGMFCDGSCTNSCGNGSCDAMYNEDPFTCPIDCSSGGYCGDGTCDANENSYSCSTDCGAGSYCGNGTCDAGEDASNCSMDCGSGSCGNGTCDAGEDPMTCPLDCGMGGTMGGMGGM